MEQAKKQIKICPVAKKCGGCEYAGESYEDQLLKKQKNCEKLLGKFGKVEPIIGMNYPYYYRHKVHHALARDKKGNIISGSYMKGTRRVVYVDECLLEDKGCQKIITDICQLLKSFKITIYSEDSGYGLMRHILVRKGNKTGEIMVILVAVSPIFPSKNNFCKALVKLHPEITTIVLNVNAEDTSMVLGERNIVLYGPGKIKEKLCGQTFFMSPNSFFQVNPMQTEKLYNTAMKFADLEGAANVIDAYCGTGTIGLIAAKDAKNVIGVDLNGDAIKNAITNAKENGIKNARFYSGDAGEFMEKMAAEGTPCDVVFMDPPRSGSTKQFMNSVLKLAPERVVYISCNPETLARDLNYFTSKKYKVKKIQPVDMFPFTEHCETVCLLSKLREAKHHVSVKLNMEALKAFQMI